MDGIHLSRPIYLRHIVEVIGECCQRWGWAIQMPDGIFRSEAATDPDDPRYALHLREAFSTSKNAWFKPGLIPEYLKLIAHDTMSFYLGFDADVEKLHAELDGDISPRPHLFETIERHNCCYLMLIDEQWWEGYSSVPLIKAKLRMRLDGHRITSDRWTGDGVASFPEFDP